MSGYIFIRFFPMTLILSATFSFFRNVNDYLIIGKWMGVFIVACVFISTTAISRLVSHSSDKKYQNYYVNIKTVTISMVLINIIVTSYCFLQLLGFLPSCCIFPITADFDNPAGVSSTLVASYPYVGIVFNNKKNKIFAATSLFIINALLLFLIQSRAGILALTVCFSILYAISVRIFEIN